MKTGKARLSESDDFNSARAVGIPDPAGKRPSETATFRHFPAVPAFPSDSGGASLHPGSIFPGIREIPGSGHIPGNDGKGPEPGRSRILKLSDYCVVRIRKNPEKHGSPGSYGSAETARILSVLFGVGSGNPRFRGPGSGKVKGRPRILRAGPVWGVPARP